MSESFTVFDKATGNITRRMIVPPDWMPLQTLKEGEDFVDGHYDPATEIIEDQGEPPEKLGKWKRFKVRKKTATRMKADAKAREELIVANAAVPVDPAAKLARFLAENPDVRDLIDKAAGEGVETTQPK